MTHQPGACRILVCDGEQRTSLAVVRALGHRGHTVAVCSYAHPCLAGVSRWARESFVVPNPVTDANAYAAAVQVVARAWQADVVFPVTDQSNLAVLGARDLLAPAIVPGPTMEAFTQVSDKRALLAMASTFGLHVPRQVVLEQRDADAAVLRGMMFPVVLKPSRSVSGQSRHGVSYAFTHDQLRERILALPGGAFPLLLQERVIGPGIGVFLFMHNGAVIATFAHERLREAPPSGGVSVYCKSIEAPPDLVAQSAQLLRACGWQGPAMVEFKRDRATGKHYLMEVNGRLWGSLQLAIDAGVDFPSLMVDAVRGHVPAAPPVYRVGVRLRSWWSDLELMLSRLRHSPAALEMPPGSSGRFAALGDFLRWSPLERSETFRWSDMAPFGFETRRIISRRLFGR